MYDAHSLVADGIHLYVFFSNNKFIDAVLPALFLIEAQNILHIMYCLDCSDKGCTEMLS